MIWIWHPLTDGLLRAVLEATKEIGMRNKVRIYEGLLGRHFQAAAYCWRQLSETPSPSLPADLRTRRYAFTMNECGRSPATLGSPAGCLIFQNLRPTSQARAVLGRGLSTASWAETRLSTQEHFVYSMATVEISDVLKGAQGLASW